jgi:hypothetical protein
MRSSVLLSSQVILSFRTIEPVCDGPRRPSHMALATLLVGIGQLIVASITLAVALRRK